MTTGFTIQETAERTGLTAHTLRYYERIGLVWEVYRDSAGHRRYTEQDVGWLILLTRLRATGMRAVPPPTGMSAWRTRSVVEHDLCDGRSAAVDAGHTMYL